MRLKQLIDWKLIGLLAGFYTVFNIIYVIKIYYFKELVQTQTYLTSLDWTTLLIDFILLDWVVVLAIMSVIAISTKSLLKRKVSWTKIILLHIGFSILLGLMIRAVGSVYALLKGNLNLEDLTIKFTLTRIMNVIDFNFLLYFAMISIIYSYYYLKEVKEARERQGLLENQLLNTKLQVLRTQLQPHFLFNTLNSISSLIDSNPYKAKDTVADLSDLLREVLNRKENQISLKKELDFTDKYIHLIKTRYSDHLEIHKYVEKDCLKLIVPAMLLQPIIENAVEHGYSAKHKHLVINLKIKKTSDKLIIKVTNNGKRLKESQPKLLNKGHGLLNIKERISQIYQGRASFEIGNLKDYSGVICKITIPLSET